MEVYLKRRQGDESHLPAACNPEGENAWARQKQRALPTCQEIWQDDDRNNEKNALICNCASDVHLWACLSKGSWTRVWRTLFLSFNLIILILYFFFTMFLFFAQDEGVWSLVVLLLRMLHELSLQLVMNYTCSPMSFTLSQKFKESQTLSTNLSHMKMKVYTLYNLVGII